MADVVATWLVRSSPDQVVRFKPWPRTFLCVLGQDTYMKLSQCLSPPRCINMGTGKLNAGGYPVKHLHPIKGGIEILLVTSCYRN